MITLSPEAHEEVVARLTALHSLAAGLAEAYDDPAVVAGARQMVESIDRLLELVGTADPQQ